MTAAIDVCAQVKSHSVNRSRVESGAFHLPNPALCFDCFGHGHMQLIEHFYVAKYLSTTQYGLTL